MIFMKRVDMVGSVSFHVQYHHDQWQACSRPPQSQLQSWCDDSWLLCSDCNWLCSTDPEAQSSSLHQTPSEPEVQNYLSFDCQIKFFTWRFGDILMTTGTRTNIEITTIRKHFMIFLTKYWILLLKKNLAIFKMDDFKFHIQYSCVIKIAICISTVCLFSSADNIWFGFSFLD